MGRKEPDLDAQRKEMVRDQLERRGITDERVLNAMRAVPRHLFVPQDMQRMAYWDGPLSIGSGQTISQPYVVALMTQLLRLQGDEKVLEVGCGSGYQAAVLSALVGQVISIERHNELAAAARLRLEELGYHNVKVLTGDGTLGVPTEAPFDAVIITAAAPAIPQLLKDQLQEGGRVVAPVGDRGRQVLEIHSRQGSSWKVDYSIPVMFVPLIGKHGWDKGDWGYSTW